MPVIIASAMNQDIEMNPGQRDQIVAKVASLKTRNDANQYLAQSPPSSKSGGPENTPSRITSKTTNPIDLCKAQQDATRTDKIGLNIPTN